MNRFKAIAVLALLVALAVPAYAETQTVKVSGALDVYSIYRHNYDMRDNNDAGAIPVNVAVPAQAGAGTTINQSDGDNYFMSIAQIEVAADLTDNVSVVIRILNQRDWNATAFEATDNGGFTNFRGGENDESEFNVGIDLAYVQLKEAFYAPLTLTIGRQDLWFGRGFILGANYQDPQNTLEADELTAIVSFDAVRATLDFAPWTIDAVFAQIDENSHDPENDHSFWFGNVNYQFSEYNAEWEGYVMADIDKSLLASAASGAAGTINTPRTAADNDTYTIGTRGQFDPIPQLTLGAEIAMQFGTYFATASSVDRDRNAVAGEVFGEYRFENAWKPMIGAQYVHFSGDSGVSATTNYEAWNGLFRGPTYGDIRDWQQVFYATALAVDQPAGTNQQHVSVYGSLLPMEDLKLEAWYYHFWTDENIVSGVTSLNDNIGDEVDVHTTYNYTEDVTFGLWLAFFWPGDLFNNQVGGGTAGETDASVFQSISSVKVVF